MLRSSTTEPNLRSMNLHMLSLSTYLALATQYDWLDMLQPVRCLSTMVVMTFSVNASMFTDHHHFTPSLACTSKQLAGSYFRLLDLMSFAELLTHL